MPEKPLNTKCYSTRKQTIFSQPATYSITVEGYLDESWSGRLDGMTITTISQGEQDVKTTLVGRVRDQADLFGVLNTLYELHIPLLTVKTQPPA